MKHYWDEAAFIPELADADRAWRVASRFAESREDDLIGGFVGNDARGAGAPRGNGMVPGRRTWRGAARQPRTVPTKSAQSMTGSWPYYSSLARIENIAGSRADGQQAPDVR